MRIAFLLGAGCPLAIRVPDGGGTKPLIPDIAGLTEQVRSAIESSQAHASSFVALLKHLTDDGHEKPNVEEILSRIRGLRGFIGARTIDGLSKGMLETLEGAICDRTTEIVRARLPSTGTPYHQLAAWIRGIKRSHPVEIFTPNYDLLIEQAPEESRVPYFDGFVGSDRTFFDVGAMEQDDLPPRWARLWKLHGSINWW
ncbi:MAG: hypothetical protein HC897_01430 [Thermoanaerobaculia bacterium]|nr:hypothetical protein [Thermoanaerobaculia bacterium]